MVNQKKPWFNEGLRFKCTGCGKCCTGPSGHVWLTEAEAEAMAKHLKMPLEDFAQKYMRRIGNRLALRETKRGKDYDCVFLDGKQCTVYDLRPEQCRTYPWWPDNINTPEDWKQEAKRCEGINHPDAPLISLGDIEKQLH